MDYKVKWSQAASGIPKMEPRNGPGLTWNEFVVRLLIVAGDAAAVADNCGWRVKLPSSK